MIFEGAGQRQRTLIEKEARPVIKSKLSHSCTYISNFHVPRYLFSPAGSPFGKDDAVAAP